MSLMERAFEAAGGARWSSLRRFTTHLLLDGAAVRPLQQPHSLKAIVAEGDLESRSIRISGFSDAGGAWGFFPDFVTIQRDDGAFVGACRYAPLGYRSAGPTRASLYAGAASWLEAGLCFWARVIRERTVHCSSGPDGVGGLLWGCV